MDLMSYGGVGLERTAANSFVPCQTLQPPAPRFVLPARWLHLPYGAQSSTHRPGMLYAMMVMMGLVTLMAKCQLPGMVVGLDYSNPYVPL